MAQKVRPKGQVVIAKDIRDRLGIQPGWVAIQRVVDGHVEMDFVPPAHDRSLKGALERHVRAPITGREDWEEIRERAWTEHAIERFAPEKTSP